MFGILLALMAGAAQSAWAQTSVTTADALYDAVTKNQTVTLGQDITLRTDGRLHIDGTTVTLDLNGHTLTRPMTAADAGGQVIAVMNGGKLTVTDSSGSNSGKITGGWSYQGSGIYVYEGCSLTISGGTITGNRSDQIEGEGTNYGYGGGVENHGTMTITGGNITGNTAGQFGGGIHNEGTLTMTGGTIANNTAGTYGGAIYSNSTVGISGATLSGNTAQSGGGAICSEGTLTLDGVTITGNQAQNGGGIYLFGTGTAQLKGETAITGNTASYGIDVYQNKDATLNIQDRPVVDDLYLTEYSFVTLTAPLTTGASIGLNAQKVDQTHLTLHYPDYHAGTDPQTFFTSKNDACLISLRPDGVDGANEVAYGIKYIERAWDAAEKRVTETTKGCSCYTPINGNNTDDDGWVPLYDGWYVVTGNSTYKALVVLGTDVKLIIPDGITLTTSHVKLESGKKLTIYGQGGDTGMLTAINEEFSNAAGIGGGEEASAGTLIIHGGIINATGEDNAAGIGGGSNRGFAPEAINGGLTIYGGSVTAKGGKYGAGIGSGDECPSFAGYINIYGGIITAKGGFEGAGIGGGDYGNGAILYIYGGTIDAKTRYHVGDGDTSLSDGYASGIGGGRFGNAVHTYIYGGSVTADSGISGAAIGGGNGSNHSGKGNGGNIEIHGGTITATKHGSGAAIGCGNSGESATIVITGGTVNATTESSFSACIGGGGDDNPTLNITISGGTITANGGYQSIGAGCRTIGGEYDYQGTLTITGGKIYATGTNRAFGGENVASLMTLYDGAMVKAGNTADEAVLFSAGERVAACVYRKYAAIEPCTHSGSAFTIDDGLTHHTSCQYCQVGAAGQAESHVFAEDGKCLCGLYSLKDDADNGEVISALAADQNPHPVTLTGRTLWKDGAWNTLCLPFALGDSDTDDNLTFTGTPLEGATVKTLESTDFAGGTLTLNFSTNNLTAIEAGTPYIVKWNKPDTYVAYDGTNAATSSDLVNPVFRGVTIAGTPSAVETNELAFRGIFSPFAISGEDRSLLYLGADNKLYYPNAAMTIGAFRAYFELAEGITAGDPASGIRSFVLNFDGEETGIREINASTPSTPSNFSNASNLWFTLDGSCLNGKPAQRGLYIHKGRKVLIK